MSYYFCIVGTQDNPLFEHEFGTSKQGGDGHARWADPAGARHMNQFVLHSSLDVVEELQWASTGTTGVPTPSGGGGGGAGGPGGGGGGGQGQLYLKCVDRFFNSWVSCFVTGSNAKFLLLHQPLSSSSAAPAGASSTSATSVAANPTSPQTEEAIRNFMVEVYENFVKAAMSPFYRVNMEIRSPVFRQRVAAAARKYL